MFRAKNRWISELGKTWDPYRDGKANQSYFFYSVNVIVVLA